MALWDDCNINFLPLPPILPGSGALLQAGDPRGLGPVSFLLGFPGFRSDQALGTALAE